MIRFLHSISNTKIVGNAKLVIITLLFASSIIYAFFALSGFVYNSEYSRTLSFQSLKLDESKEYIFAQEYKNSASPSTIIIPMGRVNMPDSLCSLYYNKEWKLRLTPKLRTSHTDKTKESIFYPFCRLNKKKSDYNDADFFHSTTKTPTQNDLLEGVRFNNALGRDAFIVKLEQSGNDFFLTNGIAFFTNRNVPISDKKKNIIELDFCINGDTLGNSKYVFSFPFLGYQNQPERKSIIIENDKINYNETSQSIGKDDFTFFINDCVFRLKSNYSGTTKWFILPLMFVFIAGCSLLMLWRIYILTNVIPNFKQRNLIKVEQFNILSLRVLFNCIILLGFPILLLKTQEKESRLWLISAFSILLNINWINTLKWLTQKVKSNGKKIPVISIIVVAVTMFAIYFTSNELVLGQVPVLKVTAIIFIFLPFAISCFSKFKIPFFEKIKNKVRVRAFANEEHSSRDAKDKSEQEFAFNLICYSILVILVLLIAFFSGDFATLIFTLLSLFLILIISLKRFRNFIKTSTRKERIYAILFLLFVIVGIVIYLSHNIDEKKYRFQSSLFFPDNEERFGEFPNIESSRETIAGQIFLLNSVRNKICPDFKTVILPECKSVFFSDYAVLWSFKTGGWLWVLLYSGVLLMLSYTVISLLIIFNKPIKLKTGKKGGGYNKKIIFGLTILIAITLVQYIYTFLTNFWAIPLTGQSPGLLSPANYEYIFHIILINYLYLYLVSSIEDRQNLVWQDSDRNKNISSYIQTKFKSFIFPMIVFTGSICWLFYQRHRINDHLQNKGNEMSWEIAKDSTLNSLYGLPKDTLLAWAHKSFEKMYRNTDEQRKFRNYLLAYYQSNSTKKRHSVDANYIQKNTNIDSVTSIRYKVLQKNANSCVYSKYLNGKPTLFINNKYYSGCPPNAETVNFELQGKLNKALDDWAKKIDSKPGFKMCGGSIIVAENARGYISASASYPFLYNENEYHVKYTEDAIKNNLQFNDYVKIRFSNGDSYVNFSECDMMPGSIVKPLLVYCGLCLLPENHVLIQQRNLNVFLGKSLPNPAVDLFKEIVVKNSNLDTLKAIYKKDLGISQFYDINDNNIPLDNKTLASYAIGQQNKLVFKEVLQAYTRIKTGRKIKFTYEKEGNPFEFDPLSNVEKIKVLHEAMSFKHNATANNIRNIYQSDLVKTGTAEILGSKIHNRTSAFIIITNEYTIGIQLYGIVPGYNTGCHAKDVFEHLIPILRDCNILH